MEQPREILGDQPRGGRGVMARNVLANWLWYLLVMVMGFLVPRLVDGYRGQELLGVWDFGWSLVVYISFLAFGVTSAVNRYVARFRTTGDWEALNRTVNSSLAVLSACGCAGLLAAFPLAAMVPRLLTNSAAEVADTAQWLVLILAAKAAFQLPAGVFNGVITGCERFDLLNGIRIARDGGALITIVVLLSAGYGILAMATTILVGEVLAGFAKFVVARALCDQLRWSAACCRWQTIKELLSFGGKTFVQTLARGGIYQGSSLLVGIFLGPVSLAVYSRQRALVMHTLRFVKQYAQVFIPRSSALDAAGDSRALQRTLIQTSKYGLYITLPLILVLLIMGAPLLNVWMGPDYEAPWVLAVMALGHLLYVPQLGVYSVLMGMGKHGVPAWFELAAALASILLGLVVLGPLGGGLLAAAVAMTVPLALSGGLLLPAYACRRLGLALRSYVLKTVPGPMLASLPLLLCMLISRLCFAQHLLTALGVGVGIGGVLTALVYLRWVLPVSVRRRVFEVIGRLLGRGGRVSSVAKVP